MSVMDGESCPGCGLPNYQGLCPHCTGDQALYEQELAPYFGSTVSTCANCGRPVDYPPYCSEECAEAYQEQL